MPSVQIIYVDLSRLHRTEHGVTVVRLMMAFNDIALANHTMAENRKEQPRLRQHVQWGAVLYFIRLQCGHLVEALEIIREIKANDSLMRTVERCPLDARKAFTILTSCLEQPGRAEFGRYVWAVRDKVAFHYDTYLIRDALEDRATRPESRRSRIFRSDDLALWRCQVADHIMDSIVSRHVWRIPRDADLRGEADRISDYAAGLCHSFLVFAADFVSLYVLEHAAV